MKIGPLVIEIKFEKKQTYFAGLLHGAIAKLKGQTYYPSLGVYEAGWIPTEHLPSRDDLERYALSGCAEGTEVEIVGTVTMKRYDHIMREFYRDYETVIFYRYRVKA